MVRLVIEIGHLVVSVLGLAILAGIGFEDGIVPQQLADGGQMRTQIVLNSFHIFDDIGKY